MKKEARIQGEKMFLKAGGKITNREIAGAVKVNPLTVGRWKREDNWEEKLKELQRSSVKEPRAGVVRKKEARDQALASYMEAGGNVTNKELAMAVGVSPATISKWKETDNWIEQIEMQPVEIEEAPTRIEEPGLDMGELAAPEQIIQINHKIDLLLQREYLSASEVADLAEAKAGLLDALEIYLNIVREVSEKGDID
jgi:uncharacterized protein YjcR